MARRSSRSGKLPRDAHLFADRFAARTLVYRNKALRQVLADLGRREITSVLIEGGGNVLGQAFDARLVDKVQFYLAPLFTGGPVLAVAGKGAGSNRGWRQTLADAIRENRSRSDRHWLSAMGWRNG